MKLPATAKWIALALVGLAIAGGVAIAASALTSQQIGISAEPIEAGDTLAPHSGRNHGSGDGGGTEPTTPTEPTSGEESTAEPETSPPTTPAEPETDDHGGDGGSGGGEGGDD